MNAHEYLLSYGLNGDFGRFRTEQPLALRRGARVVVHSHRGLELATVLKPAQPGLVTFLPNTTVGALLRPATSADLSAADQTRVRAAQVAECARQSAQSLELPLEVLDAEVLLDGQRGVLHLVRWAECDVRPFVSGLARDCDLQIELADLTAREPEHDHEHGGCGSCGSEGGGCGSCGSEGGGCGSCGTAKVEPQAVAAHFAELREKLEQRHALL